MTEENEFKKHIVKEGDCISSIAFQNGFFPETIWKDAANDELREQRKNPNVLMPDDVVAIPELRLKEVEKPSGEKHKFRRRGVPEKLRFQMLLNNQPRSDLEYTVDIDGKLTKGLADVDGNVEIWVPPDATKGKLIISKEEQYDLALGALPPIAKEVGVRARLVNLGYLEDPKADSEVYQRAIEAFQSGHSIALTGKADKETQEKLLEIHGC